jgi:hypothetical protein
MSEEWLAFGPLIHELESRGLVTRTFRRLDPDRQLAVLTASVKEVARRAGAR